MAINTAGDLDRMAWDAPYTAGAACQEEGCGFEAEGASPPTIKAKARAHARETGHVTRAVTERITEYTPTGKDADDA